jgi:hypothetical protein
MTQSRRLKPSLVSYGVFQGDMKRTIVAFPVELHKQIRALALDNKSNFGATVRELVIEALEARNK